MKPNYRCLFDVIASITTLIVKIEKTHYELSAKSAIIRDYNCLLVTINRIIIRTHTRRSLVQVHPATDKTAVEGGFCVSKGDFLLEIGQNLKLMLFDVIRLWMSSGTHDS